MMKTEKMMNIPTHIFPDSRDPQANLVGRDPVASRDCKENRDLRVHRAHRAHLESRSQCHSHWNKAVPGLPDLQACEAPWE